MSLFQPNVVPKKEQRARSWEGDSAPGPQASPLSRAAEVMTTQVHSKANACEGRFLVSFNATKKLLSLATQIHLPWTGAAFQRHTSK